MEFTAQQIASAIHGTIEGDPQVKVDRLAKIEEGVPGALTFLANPKYTQFIYTTRASIVIVNQDFKAEQSIAATLIRVEDAYSAFAGLLDLYRKANSPAPGVSSLAFIADTATIGKDTYIGEFAYIGAHATVGDGACIYPQVYLGDNTKVGSRSTIYPGVRVYHDCHIGNDCTLHAGVVIGSDGFGFAPQEGKDYKKIAQIGNVMIEDNVEIGSNTTIDRATLGSTIIRKGAKLDNLIQIAHNVEIGENTVIAAQAGISGSTRVGKNCMVAGQVGLTGHLDIGDDVKIGAQSGISTDLKDGSIVLGSPAFEISRYRKAYVYFRNLPDLVKRLEALEKIIKGNK